MSLKCQKDMLGVQNDQMSKCQRGVKEIKMPQVFAPHRKEQGVKVSSVNLDTPLKRYINK